LQFSGSLGKLLERSEAFTTSRRSASKLLNTLLKKDVGSASRAQVDVLRCSTVSSKIMPSVSSKTDIVTIFSGCGLICLTPEKLNDVLITFLILLIFSEKKEANSLHFLSESISLGIWLGGFVSLSTVAKRVCVCCLSCCL